MLQKKNVYALLAGALSTFGCGETETRSEDAMIASSSPPPSQVSDSTATPLSKADSIFSIAENIIAGGHVRTRRLSPSTVYGLPYNTPLINPKSFQHNMPLVSPQGFRHNMPLIKPNTNTEFFIRYIAPKPNTDYK